MGSKGIHYARLHNSPRLQRLLRLLADGKWHTTLEIVLHAQICAVNSAVCELRRNGIEVECEQQGKGLFYYRLGKGRKKVA